MIVVFIVFYAIVIGGTIDIAWLSVDALLGTKTITGDKAAAVIGISGVGTALFVGAMMIVDEWRHG